MYNVHHSPYVSIYVCGEERKPFLRSSEVKLLVSQVKPQKSKESQISAKAKLISKLINVIIINFAVQKFIFNSTVSCEVPKIIFLVKNIYC